MAADDLEPQIAQLRDLGLDDLRLRWRTEFGRAAPTGLPRQLLFRLFVYRLQAETFGDVSPTTLQLLERLHRKKDSSDSHVPLPSQLGGQDSLRTGTVLVREHDGVSHHVMVVRDGFAWSGKTYSSLSQVATAITGTGWNGPRFFGLRQKGEAI